MHPEQSPQISPAALTAPADLRDRAPDCRAARRDRAGNRSRPARNCWYRPDQPRWPRVAQVAAIAGCGRKANPASPKPMI
jgi:hypothetical protein